MKIVLFIPIIHIYKDRECCFQTEGYRHGLIAGATGTGKTITLQRIAESLSGNGVPVFLADVKGDLAGISRKGTENPRIMERVKLLGLVDHAFREFPVAFWDVFGISGHPVRATVSDMGPLLMGRLFNLNEVQTMAKSAARSIGSSIGRRIIRGVPGSIFGRRK